MTNRTPERDEQSGPDKYNDMAAITGKAGGLDEKQWPGLAIILRSVARDTIEECAKVAESFISNESGTEFDGGYEHGRRQVAEEIRSLHHSHPGLEREKE